MIVDLNSRISSLKKSENILIRITIYVIMTALILTGSAPSFADEKTSDSAYETVPSADISWDDAPELAATFAILIDAGSDQILYEKNAYERREPASMTKMLTSLIAIETLDMDQQITAPDLYIDQEGTNINLKKGEVLTVEQLLYAILLASANEAADTVAITIGGSVEEFSDMMDERAARCGAKDTDFSSASGLTTGSGKEHLTTAYDMAMIAKEAMKNPIFREIVGTSEYTIPKTNMSEERKLENSNVCLYKDDSIVEVNGKKRPLKYEGMTGIKTGFIEAAGYCICGSAKRGDTELIGVILNSGSSKERFADIITLLDYGFSKYSTYTAAKSNEEIDTMRVWQGEKSGVPVEISEDMDITVNKDYDTSNITVKTSKKEFMIKAPIEKGQTLGYLKAYNEDGEVIAVADLIAMEDVEKGGVLSYIGIADEDRTLFIVTVISALLILIIIRILFVRSRRKKQKRRRARRNRNVRRREWEKEKNPFDN